MMNKRRPFPVFLLAALVLLLARPALAQKSPSQQASGQTVTRRAEVEVIEIAAQGGKQKKATLMVTVVGDNHPSSLIAHIAGADYRIAVEQRTRSAAAITKLSIKSTQRAGGNTILDLDAWAVTPLGKRIVVSQVQNPDGSKFEVAVTVRYA